MIRLISNITGHWCIYSKGSFSSMVVVLLALSLTCGCTKDPVPIVENSPVECSTFFTEHSFLTDTLVRTHNTESWGSIHLDLRAGGIHSFYLMTQTTAHWLSPSAGYAYNQYVTIRGVTDDSV